MRAHHYAGICLLLCGGPLLASFGPPGPIPIADTGTHIAIQVGLAVAPYSSGTDGNMGYGAGPSGGQFLGTVAGDPNYTGFWCVDDQLFFKPGTSNFANITVLSPGIDNNSKVRYSNVTNAGSPQWTNQTVNGDTLSSSATVRYEMAAWLISQYTGFDIQISTTNKPRSDAIQKAIWAILNNSSPTQQQAGFSAIGAIGTDTTAGYWVHQAYVASTNGFLGYDKGLKAFDATKWAVVSWGVKADGTLDTGGYTTSSPALQTFLVEVVPEPGFYGALALGFTGLAFFIRRKRRLENRPGR